MGDDLPLAAVCHCLHHLNIIKGCIVQDRTKTNKSRSNRLSLSHLRIFDKNHISILYEVKFGERKAMTVSPKLPNIPNCGFR